MFIPFAGSLKLVAMGYFEALQYFYYVGEMNE